MGSFNTLIKPEAIQDYLYSRDNAIANLSRFTLFKKSTAIDNIHTTETKSRIKLLVCGSTSLISC
jgi:hypothetical protein